MIFHRAEFFSFKDEMVIKVKIFNELLKCWRLENPLFDTHLLCSARSHDAGEAYHSTQSPLHCRQKPIKAKDELLDNVKLKIKKKKVLKNG